ncbi:hypothetical protein B0T19DRAFT_222303 [Cercophora scortea]|uniref:Uncharacterized protein n=1 Tax=Cercophora scortea TaxID=314031 RepID=A0AAE0M976_9PEZI|nr:hypothetical protein B0T19DRAFT_222303 [Cercophora scortea]
MVMGRFGSFLSNGSRRSSFRSWSGREKALSSSQLGNMTSEHRPSDEEPVRTPGTYPVDARSQNSTVAEEEEEAEEAAAANDTSEQQHQDIPLRKKTNPRDPAYVSPIPKIGPIPPINPDIGVEFSGRPKLPPFVGSYLMGKPVNEYGDIVDDKTGQLLARAGGDLPSMVGRHVSNRQGDILGDDGELLGYVADIEIEKKNGPQSPKSLFEIMGRSKASLMVDHQGNILDAEGNIVGKFHDNNNPLHRAAREEEEKKRKEEPTPKQPEREPPPPPPPAATAGPASSSEQEQNATQPPEAGQGKPNPPRRTEEERRENAAAWRKENPGESPSDIFLDVKSTTEGIQLTIRIPTVFGSQQMRPNISFS